MTSKTQPMDQGIIENIKCNYRCRILKKILVVPECDMINKISIVDSINVLATVWNIHVKPQTVFNCFKEAEFNLKTVWDEEDEVPLKDLAKTIEHENFINLFENYTKKHNVENINWIDYLNVDEDLSTVESDLDSSIIQKIQTVCENESDEKETANININKKPAFNEINSAVEVLQNALLYEKDVPVEYFNFLTKLENFFKYQLQNNLIQQPIENYLHRYVN